MAIASQGSSLAGTNRFIRGRRYTLRVHNRTLNVCACSLFLRHASLRTFASSSASHAYIYSYLVHSSAPLSRLFIHRRFLHPSIDSFPREFPLPCHLRYATCCISLHFSPLSLKPRRLTCASRYYLLRIYLVRDLSTMEELIVEETLINGTRMEKL